MRHQAGFLGDQAPEVVVDGGGVNGGQAQSRKFRHRQQQPADHLPERRPPREVGTVGGNVDAGQHDFLVSAGDQGADLFGDGADRDRAIGTAAERDDAESAPVVAPLLHLHEGSGSASERGDQMRGGLARGHDVGNRGSSASQPVFRPQFVVIAEHAADVGQRGPGRGVDLSGATGDDDAGLGTLAGHAANGLPGLAFCFRGNGTCVDDHGLGGAGGQAAHNLAFVCIQAAAEGEDVKAHKSICPWKAVATGPAMRT